MKKKDFKEISDINMTPFVDIVLVLLIIFMSVATFIVEGKIPVNLPKAKTSQSSSKDNSITITIKKDGELYINDQKISQEDLIKALSKYKDKTVVLRASKETPFQYVVNVIDACRQNSITHYLIETKKD